MIRWTEAAALPTPRVSENPEESSSLAAYSQLRPHRYIPRHPLIQTWGARAFCFFSSTSVARDNSSAAPHFIRLRGRSSGERNDHRSRSNPSSFSTSPGALQRGAGERGRRGRRLLGTFCRCRAPLISIRSRPHRHRRPGIIGCLLSPSRVIKINEPTTLCGSPRRNGWMDGWIAARKENTARRRY